MSETKACSVVNSFLPTCDTVNHCGDHTLNCRPNSVAVDAITRAVEEVWDLPSIFVVEIHLMKDSACALDMRKVCAL